jgi:hypothetical protein
MYKLIYNMPTTITAEYPVLLQTAFPVFFIRTGLLNGIFRAAFWAMRRKPVFRQRQRGSFLPDVPCASRIVSAEISVRQAHLNYSVILVSLLPFFYLYSIRIKIPQLRVRRI